MSDVKVILVTTVWNREQYISKCLDSAVNSTLDKSKWVHLVVDNASSDNAGKIAKEYCEKYDHMYFIQNEKNIGQMPVYNFALDWVKEKFPECKYFCCLDSDDLVSSRALEYCLNLFEKDKRIDVSYSDFNVLDGKGNVLQKRHPKSKRFVSENIELKEEGQKMYRVAQLNKKNGNFATHFRFIRLDSFFEKMGKFRIDKEFSTDFLIYSECLGAGMTLIKIDETLYHWRCQPKKRADGKTCQVEKDFGKIQHDDWLALRDEYEQSWKMRGLI